MLSNLMQKNDATLSKKLLHFLLRLSVFPNNFSRCKYNNALAELAGMTSERVKTVVALFYLLSHFLITLRFDSAC